MIKRLWAIAWWKKILILLVLVGIGLWVKGHFFAAPKMPRYRTAVVKKGEIVDSVEASGPLSPLNTTTVGALVSGEILKIYVDYNTVVKKGDLLAIIDPTQTQADYDQAMATLSSVKEDLAASKTAFDLAKINKERYEELYAKNYVAKSSLEEYELAYVRAKSSLNSAQSSVIQAQARVDSVKKNLDNTKIISPIDGIVLSKEVSEGQSLTSGFSTPELFTLAQDLTKMQIEAKVSEADVVKINEGTKATFTLDGYPGEKFEGTIRQVRTNYSSSSSMSSSSTANYTLIIDVDNTDGKFMPGMTATITIAAQDKKDILLVPNEALRFAPSTNEKKYNTTGVWILGEDEQPKRIDVSIGIVGTEQTEIKEGDLKEGDKVIVRENNGTKAMAQVGMGRPGGNRRR